MNEAATVGVLQDVFVLGMIALVLGLGVYAWLRRAPDHTWHTDGNVLSRPYDYQDGVTALAVISVFCLGLFSSPQQKAAAATGKLEASMSFSVLLASSVIMLAMCVLLVLYLRVYRGFSPAEMFGLRQMRLGFAAALAVPCIIVVVVAMGLVVHLVYVRFMNGKMPDESDQETVRAFKSASSFTFRVLVGITAIVIAPLTEETIFRGFLYGVTKRFTDRWFAAVFTAVIFAVVHSHVGALLPIFVLGIGLALAYEVTGSLLVPVFMHALFNAYNVAQLAAQ